MGMAACEERGGRTGRQQWLAKSARRGGIVGVMAYSHGTKELAGARDTGIWLGVTGGEKGNWTPMGMKGTGGGDMTGTS